jgi:hypothetical protein
MLWLLSWLLFFVNIIPFLNKLVTVASFYYGRITIWKVLVKIRKTFIIFNAIIGVYMVYKTTGFSYDNILAGSTVNPTDLVQYNWFNQSLIEIKISILNLFSNGNPIDPGSPDNNGINLPININDLNPISPVLSEGSSVGHLSPTSTSSTSSLTPRLNSTNLPIINTVDTSTQTDINGIGVGRMVETTNFLHDILEPNNKVRLQDFVDSTIKEITD